MANETTTPATAAPVTPATAAAPDATTVPSSATAAPPAPNKAAVKEAARKLKLKFEGKEEELDEEEVIKLAQLGKMGHKKSQEKADLEKQINDFVSRLQNDPFEVLSDPRLGVDVKAKIVNFLEKQVEEEKKSPEQRAQEQSARELQQLRDEKKQLEAQNAQERLARETEKAAIEIDSSIKGAIKESGLPESAYVIKRFADYMLAALDNKLDLGPKEIAPLVKREIEGEIREMFKASPDEMIEQFLGKDRLGGMKKKRMTDAQKQAVASVQAVKDTGQSSKPTAPVEQKKMSVKDFFKLKG